jgi:molybdopterin-guanine dinucleotide biosynthesis adapter protein
MPANQRVFGVTGWKNTGKTNLLTALVENLTGIGYTVSTVKHAHHGFDIDHEGRDSWRHRMAGATETAIVSATRWALMHELRGDSEPNLADILAKMAPCDLVLVEGFKREPHPKIEVLAGQGGEMALWHHDPSIVAIAADVAPAGCHLPYFVRSEATAIADFIVYHQELSPKSRRADHAG